MPGQQMGKSLSPAIKRELANLDKDADSRREVLTALKSFVKDLDSKAIPLFLAEVSRSRESGSLSGECAVSLYESLARSHGSEIVPFIDTITDSIVKTLASSSGSFSLQQACSNLVPAIARYSIDPGATEDSKRRVIHSLCEPLSGSLLSSRDSLSSGASLCLKALVESDNWRFASFEMVNRVCQNVAGALEEGRSRGDSLAGLVAALAKRNAVAVEPYARLLVRSGLRVIETGTDPRGRMSAVQMIDSLMKSLDPRSVSSEARSVIEGMESCLSDPTASVRGAAHEALRTARRIAGEDIGIDRGSVTGSNFGRRRLVPSQGDLSPASASPLSRTFDSMVEHDYSLISSPILSTQDIQYLDRDSRSIDRNIWSHENGDASFGSNLERSCGDKFVQSNGNHDQEFFGFSRTRPRRGISKSATTSPIRSRTPVRVDNEVFRTPRNNYTSRAGSERPPRWSRNHFPDDVDRSPVSRCEGCEWRENETLYVDVDHFQGCNESLSFKEDIRTVFDLQNVVPEKKIGIRRVTVRLVCGLSIALLAVVGPMALLSGHDEGGYLVPT